MARPDINDILGDTELLSILGAINVEWDEIEVFLWYLFWKTLGGHWNKSYAILYSQQNHRARREMVEALIAASLEKDDPDRKKMAGLLGRMKRAAQKRNEITHGVWSSITKAGKKELHRIPIKRNYEQLASDAYSKSDLKRLLDQVTKLRIDLDDYLQPFLVSIAE